jgi:tetratricopeptide (TPR) repeat protein
MLATALALLWTIALAPPAPATEGPDAIRALAHAIEQAVARADVALAEQEPQVAESALREALLEGWLLWGELEAVEGRAATAREAFERAGRATFDDDRAVRALARHDLREGRARDAVTLLRRHLTGAPGDVEARLLVARALIAEGEVEEALQELEESLAAAPGDLEVVFSLATGYLRVGRVADAERLFERLATERPVPQTWVLIGRTWRDFGEVERARAALARALELDPTVRRARYYLGTVELTSEGRASLEAAIEHFRDELRVAPDDPITSLYLGMSLVEHRSFEESEAPLRAALESPVTALEAHHHLGRALLGLDRSAEAAAALRRALVLLEANPAVATEVQRHRSRQLSSAHYQLALALRRLGDEQQAAAHFAEAERFSNQLTRDVRQDLGEYLRESPEHEGASSLLAIGEESPVEHLAIETRRRLGAEVRAKLALAHLNLGVLHARAERFAQAIEPLELAAELDPTLPRAHYSLGVALFNDSRFEPAATALEIALDRQPDDESARRMLALASLNAERYGRAAALLERDPRRATDPSLQYAYGLALARSDRAEEAEPVFAALLREHAQWPELHVVLGQALAEQGDYDGAVVSLQRALAARADVAEAHSTLAAIHLRRGDLEASEAALRAELRSHPRDQRARYQLATVLELQGRVEEAEVIIREVIASRPGHGEARYLLGKILLQRGDTSGAAAQLEVAAELRPEDASVRNQLGQAYQQLGRVEEARAEFERFRQLKRERPLP